MIGHNPARDGESKAGADFTGRKIGGEQALTIFGSDSPACVGDGQTRHSLVACELACDCPRRGRLTGERAHTHSLASPEGWTWGAGVLHSGARPRPHSRHRVAFCARPTPVSSSIPAPKPPVINRVTVPATWAGVPSSLNSISRVLELP